ncbi:hypothetical protein AAZX31_13G095700 [Glycine max]|uniref:Uncharacterized protein n=1 Tax=Glycine max TaxID=3847 RepID=I1LY92_SOYBN|nr:uncharacterized protein LOC100806863 [Glycine max]KAG4959246.1 hypothetical protein JHK87_035879 [Glycine soja]KAG4976667.1 hypothetical protein JHK86_036141 [Glycine max]KAG5112684.1 hypothetical protein JHK82_035953 [Glycine max]KAG5129963.1 hypothetical protein JHK84_036360 [Glycine max]KAH1100918.1 hypothetical protein GYH30_035854 [Glycine max]|eukprot:XP_003542376.1 uncharacterized protein LOC100806863 [Glycine max]
MNGVSPLEAQAFNYLSFGFLTLLNNFWTWLAFTFWRTRAPTSELLPPPDDPVRDESDPVAVTGPSPTVVDVDGARKGKFTLYYEDESERECESHQETTALTERDGRGLKWWESWEELLKIRRGEDQNGWYTCQDLTVLNGSVVRLWDGGFGFGTSPQNPGTLQDVFLYGKLYNSISTDIY